MLPLAHLAKIVLPPGLLTSTVPHSALNALTEDLPSVRLIAQILHLGLVVPLLPAWQMQPPGQLPVAGQLHLIISTLHSLAPALLLILCFPLPSMPPVLWRSVPWL
jgi:hypothetical protein